MIGQPSFHLTQLRLTVTIAERFTKGKVSPDRGRMMVKLVILFSLTALSTSDTVSEGKFIALF